MQSIGVPMGTNCASMLANIYLARYELVFLQTLARVMHTHPPDSQLHIAAHRVGHAFTLTRRYIDDLGSINNPYLRHLLYNNIVFYDEIHGIYPRCLTLKLVQRGASMDYMDSTIGPSGRGNRLTTICYDKREHPPLSPLFIVSLPHASSQISDTSKYGVITSQLYRFSRNILLRGDFVFRVAELLVILYGKGYDIERMHDMVCRFCRGHNLEYGTDVRALLRKIDAKLHSLLDCMTQHFYVALFADPETRARVIVRDMRAGLDGLTCADT